MRQAILHLVIASLGIVLQTGCATSTPSPESPDTARLRVKLEFREAEVADMTDALVKLEMEIERLNDRYVTLGSTVQKRDRKIAHLEDSVYDLKQHIAVQEKAIHERDVNIDGLWGLLEKHGDMRRLASPIPEANGTVRVVLPKHGLIVIEFAETDSVWRGNRLAIRRKGKTIGEALLLARTHAGIGIAEILREKQTGIVQTGDRIAIPSSSGNKERRTKQSTSTQE